jgi:hypothetical protein
MAVAAEAILLVLSMAMPWLVARMVPLSTTAPLIVVLLRRLMPVAAVMLPELEMVPVKVETPRKATERVGLKEMFAPSPMPAAPAEMVPLLVMPPVKFWINWSAMPVLTALIVPLPLLLMVPAKLKPKSALLAPGFPWTKMP